MLQQSALACSVALHAGLLAWVGWPPSAIEMPPQQVVDVSVVMVSAPPALSAPEPVTNEILPPAPRPAPVAAQPVRKSAPAAQPREEAAPPSAPSLAGIPTTGPQAMDATRRVSALTEPVYDAATLHNQPPAYPEDARRDGAEGKVMLDVSVSAQGHASDVAIGRSSGHRELDYAARNAVRQWRFIPAQRDGETVEAKVIVPVEFRLE